MNGADQVAADLLGDIDWQPDGFGYILCPGADTHQNRTNRRDTRVYIDGAPTIFCVHSSCLGAVEDANRRLRSAIGKLERGKDPVVRKIEKSPEQLARERDEMEAARLATMAVNALPKILTAFSWPVVDIWHDSPELLDDVATDWRRLLCLFDPSDVLWVGDLHDSGKPEHAVHFRTAAEWLGMPTCPAGPHVSPFVYAPGSFSRKSANILKRKFLVVESDSLAKDSQGAILRWLRETAGLRLRAVIDTGGKSLHGWFDVPGDEVLKELAAVLPALGCDPALLRLTQGSRLPSCPRGERQQCLLYLDNEGSQP